MQPRRAGTQASLRTIKELGPFYTRTDQWQSKAYELVRAVGEAGYVVDTTANTIARTELVVTEVQPDGTTAPTEDPRALRLMRAFVGPRGGQRELKRRAALQLSIAGESYLLGSPIDPEEGEGIFWEFLSTEELRIDRAGHATRIIEGQQTAVSEEAYVARCWQADPAFSDQADSAIRRVLPILAELAILTQLVEAQTKSRLAAGALFVPDEMSFPSADDPASDGAEPIDELSEELINHLKAPLEDPTSAASLVPLLMRGPGEMGQYIRLISLADPADASWARELRDEALNRLAHSLDIPPEELQGKSTLSGLGGGNVADSIDDDFITKHVAPKIELLADFITHAFLRPMLAAFEGLDPIEASRFAVEADVSGLLGQGDEEAKAKDLYEKQLISNEAYLRALGFDPGDAASPEELQQRQIWELVSTQPAAYGKLLLQLPGFEGMTTADLILSAGPPAPQVGGEPIPAPAAAPPPSPNGNGSAPPPAAPPPSPPAASMLADRLAVAADFALDRALERAAARILTRAQRVNLDLAGRSSTTDKTAILTLLRPGELDAIGESPETLLRGAWDRYELRARGWVATHLEDDGADPGEAVRTSALICRTLVGALDEFARLHLFSPIGFGTNGLRVPDELVASALEAGALTSA